MKTASITLAVLAFIVAVSALASQGTRSKHSSVGIDPGGVLHHSTLKAQVGHQLAEFSGGCFWGVEDAFRKVKGVTATTVGYTGGKTAFPTYEDVCTHTTGHAETVLVEFDPKVVSYEELLRYFWSIHDPTTIDQQGPDYGDQYRSAIWTFSTAQRTAALKSIQERQPKESSKIVTQVKPAVAFYVAETYHQQYAEKTGTHGCPVRKRP